MPAKSAKQFRMMAGIMNGNIKATGGMPSRAVAKEMVDATPSGLRSEYSKKKKK